MKKCVFMLALLLMSSAQLLACMCSYGGSFMKVSRESDLVIVGVVVSKSGGKMKVRVTKELIGSSRNKEITIYGDSNGDSCNESVKKFREGNTYAFALKKIDKIYVLSGCGDYYLTLENGYVKGVIDEAFMTASNEWPQWNGKTLPEADFYKRFTEMGNLYTPPCRSMVSYTPTSSLEAKYQKGVAEHKAGKQPGKYSYMEAVKDNNLPLVRYYIEHADMLQQESLHEIITPAADKGHVDIIRLFLEKGGDPGIKASNGYYLIYAAVKFPELVKLLAEAGAEMNPQGYEGTTTLMYAVMVGCTDTIALLLDNGASLEDKSESGKKPVSYLEFNKVNKDEVKAFLKSRK